MKKTILFVVILATMSILLTGCSCGHEWSSATCEQPVTCNKCGETDGTPLGHIWEAPTCTQAAFCPQCGISQGKATGHIWENASCTTAKSCSVCAETDGEPLGHNWIEATCVSPKKCDICFVTEGTPLPHTVEKWNVTVPVSCSAEGSQEGICQVCASTVTEVIDKLPHTEGEWIVTEEATREEKGIRTKFCTVCDQELSSELYELSKEEKDKLFKQDCKNYTYNEIARNPDKYKGEMVKFTGTVIQVMESGGSHAFRVKLKNYKEVIYVEYLKLDSNEGRILEDDKITMYGFFAGTITYETVLGASVTIPSMIATHIDLM